MRRAVAALPIRARYVLVDHPIQDATDDEMRGKAQAALEAEQARLSAVKAAREAEEAHARSVKELARREQENLAKAKAAFSRSLKGPLS